LSAARQPTIEKVVARIARRLNAARLTYGHGTFNANEEAAWLVLHACGVSPGEFEAIASREVTPSEIQRVDGLVKRRIEERIPAAYLTHEAWLGEHRFYVDRRVIVPRSFISELLPDTISTFIGTPVRTALDLCTGSGCLAILLAHAFDKARIDGADLSKAALSVARRNVDEYRLGRRVKLFHSNLFSSLGARRYDLIVSNPPYVNNASMRKLPGEYRAEPRMALAGGEDGLVLVRRILANAGAHLNAHGVLVCEIGHNRKALERAYPRLPFTWLETSAGDEYVFLLDKKHLLRG
jgi:ribosomal protein L3 glutamine methyltransferase